MDDDEKGGTKTHRFNSQVTQNFVFGWTASAIVDCWLHNGKFTDLNDQRLNKIVEEKYFKQGSRN